MLGAIAPLEGSVVGLLLALGVFAFLVGFDGLGGLGCRGLLFVEFFLAAFLRSTDCLLCRLFEYMRAYMVMVVCTWHSHVSCLELLRY